MSDATPHATQIVDPSWSPQRPTILSVRHAPVGEKTRDLQKAVAEQIHQAARILPGAQTSPDRQETTQSDDRASQPNGRLHAGVANLNQSGDGTLRRQFPVCVQTRRASSPANRPATVCQREERAGSSHRQPEPRDSSAQRVGALVNGEALRRPRPRWHTMRRCFRHQPR